MKVRISIPGVFLSTDRWRPVMELPPYFNHPMWVLVPGNTNQEAIITIGYLHVKSQIFGILDTSWKDRHGNGLNVIQWASIDYPIPPIHEKLAPHLEKMAFEIIFEPENNAPPSEQKLM